jgi:hypothetical protein
MWDLAAGRSFLKKPTFSRICLDWDGPQKPSKLSTIVYTRGRALVVSLSRSIAAAAKLF